MFLWIVDSPDLIYKPKRGRAAEEEEEETIWLCGGSLGEAYLNPTPNGNKDNQLDKVELSAKYTWK